MTLAFRIVAVLSLCAIATQGQKPAEKTLTIHTPAYFFKAEEFLQLSEEQRQFYTRGLMDGFYASAIFGADEKKISYINQCMTGMDSRQVTAIITDYLKGHPEGWHHPASLEAYSALHTACDKLAP